MNLIHDKKDNQWERKFYSKNIRKIDNQKKIPMQSYYFGEDGK